MIPKVIHYCWFGRGKFNDTIEKCIASWKKYCPDYEIICWNEDNYDIHKNKYIEQAYSHKKWAFVTDYVRLDVIYNYGGIYLDTDVEILKPLDSMLDCEMYVGMESEKYISFGLGFGAIKGHSYLKEMMEYYETREFVKQEGTLDLTTCPIIQTDILEKYGFRKKNEYQKIPRCIIYPIEVMSPKSFQTAEINITRKTVSIHHFDMSWLKDKEKTAKIKEWKLKKKYGQKKGKIISMIITGPQKMMSHLKNEGVEGLFKYLLFIIKNIIKGRE